METADSDDVIVKCAISLSKKTESKTNNNSFTRLCKDAVLQKHTTKTVTKETMLLCDPILNW